MKILLLIDSLGPGGAQRQIVGLAVLLKEYGYDISVVCYYDNRFYADILWKNGVKYVYLKKAGNATFRIWHIARYIRHVKPNTVISYLETPSICACVAHIFNRKFRLIVSERNTTQNTGCNEIIRFNLFRMADYIVPNAFAQSYYINKRFPALKKKVVTIPNFVDLEKFTPPLQRMRRSTPEIMIAASIWRSKNTIGFIDTIAILKDKGLRFHISWYGKDSRNIDYFNECQKKIVEKGLSRYISLLEKTSNIALCYREADYFCLPSFYEGTPNVICEAMASGLPILCSNVCDNARYVEDNRNGYLFNPNDINSMALAIKKILELSDMEYESFCKNSRQMAEEKLSKSSFLKRYVDIIGA